MGVDFNYIAAWVLPLLAGSGVWAALHGGLRNRSENFIRIGAVSLDRQSPAASGNDAIRKLRRFVLTRCVGKRDRAAVLCKARDARRPNTTRSAEHKCNFF